jgi:hypothetical protein
MFVLLAKTEEMLDAVQSFMIAKHVHKMMFVLRHGFQSLHGIIGFEHDGSLLLIVVFFILGGKAEISAKKWLMFRGVVVGVCFAVFSEKVTLAFIEVMLFILHL